MMVGKLKYVWFVGFGLLLLSSVNCQSAEVAPQTDRVLIENVKVRQIESEKFTRISEFFTGKENTGHRVILRTDPEHRGGLYFVIRFSDRLTELPVDLKLRLQYFEAGSAQMKQYSFEMPSEFKKSNKLFVGVTGEAFLEKPLPVAWRVFLELSDESVYSELKSYLWEMPESFEDS